MRPPAVIPRYLFALAAAAAAILVRWALDPALGDQLPLVTLYGAVARLERRGLIEPIAAGARRRPYQLTAGGVAVLQAEL